MIALFPAEMKFLLVNAYTKIQVLLSNLSWLIGEKVLLMPLSLIISVWMARYLGPSNYGMFNYSVSFVSLFGFLTYLGLTGIVTRFLVETPYDKGELLGTAFSLKFIGANFGLLSALIIAFLLKMESKVILMIIIISFSTLFDAFNVIDLWFESKIQAKYSVIARGTSIIASFLLKAILIVSRSSVVYFALTLVVQTGINALGLLYFYWKRGGGSFDDWSYDSRRAKNLLHQAWPLIFSYAGALIYLRIDKVMLGKMVGTRSVGIYSVAAGLSEIWYFIPLAAAATLYPSMIRSKSLGKQVYEQRIGLTFSLLGWLGICTAFLISIATVPLIINLFGTDYSRSIDVLRIHIWSAPAMFMGAFLSKWLIIENHLFFSLIRHGLGAMTNILLNIWLIPTMGVEGAAIATVVSYIVANFLACFLNTNTRPAGRLMTSGLIHPLSNMKILFNFLKSSSQSVNINFDN